MTDRDRNRDEQMKCVYIGPPMGKRFGLPKGLLKKKNSVKKPYPESLADDRDPDDDPSMIDVYAGPAPEDEPEEERDQNSPIAEGVYAAPRRPDAPIMLVYAGPGYFNRINREAREEEDAPVRAEPQDAEENRQMTVCPYCEKEVPYGEYCPECGGLLPMRQMLRCPVCGSLVGKARFCAECGARLILNEENGQTE